MFNSPWFLACDTHCTFRLSELSFFFDILFKCVIIILEYLDAALRQKGQPVERCWVDYPD